MTNLSLALLSALSTPAVAGDTVTVTYNGLSASSLVTVTRPSASTISTYAGEMNVSVDGVSGSAYCIDLYHTISNGQTYTAELVSVDGSSPWGEIGWILDNYDPANGTEAATIQGAIWKLIYQDVGGVTLTPSAINTAADALVAAAAGQSPATCAVDPELDITFEDSADGTVTVTITVTQDGLAVAGELLTVGASAGYLDATVVETDEYGDAVVLLDPDGNDAVDIEVSLDGRSLYRLDPTGSVQELVAFTYEECTWSDSGSWSAVPFGDPRTIGFWGHQAGVANGTAKGTQHVSTATLSGWLPLTVFGKTYSTIAQLDTALNLKKATMSQRAQQQCLATLLNVQYGEIGWFTDMGGAGDLWELWSQAEADYAAGSYESAKTICDTINNL